MSTNAHKITAADAFFRMAPTTLVSFIADLDQHTSAYADATTCSLLTMALEALYANVGRTDAIQMMAEADISASNPIIERTVDKWCEIDAEQPAHA